MKSKTVERLMNDTPQHVKDQVDAYADKLVNKQTAVEWLEQEFIKLESTIGVHGKMYELIDQAKEIEYNQREYTKEDVLKAGEIGEINHHDYKHIVKLLDEARQINETYGNNGNLKQFSLYEHKETIATADTPTSSQKEISDEEIEKAAFVYSEFGTAATIGFRVGAKWYREEIKRNNQ